MLFSVGAAAVPRANGVPPQLAAASSATTTNSNCKCVNCDLSLIQQSYRAADQLFPLALQSPSSPPSEALPLQAVGGTAATATAAAGYCRRHRRLPSIESACAYDDMDKDTQV